MSEDKVRLRREMLAAREEMSPFIASQTIGDLALWMYQLPVDLQPGDTVAAYVATRREPGGTPMLDALVDRGLKVILPIVPEGGPDRLQWGVYEGEMQLEKGRWNLLEPMGLRLDPDTITQAKLILVPAVAMRLWAEERRMGTMELLFTLSVTPMQAIAGKMAAAWGFLCLALALTFPIPLTAGWLGNPDWGVVASGYLSSALLAGAYLAVGLFTSALTRNQVISFVLAVVGGLFLILAGYEPVTTLLSQWAPRWLVDGVAAAGFMTHFQAMQRGVLDLRNFVYFASVIGFMLFLTQLVLNNRSGR